MSFYKTIVRPLLFRVDPERMHDMTVGLSKWAGKAALMRLVMLRAYAYRDPVLECEVARMHFANPVGLAAGWDKSGVAIAGAGCLARLYLLTQERQFFKKTIAIIGQVLRDYSPNFSPRLCSADLPSCLIPQLPKELGHVLAGSKTK